MRRGEACALRWCHIDATSGTIQVNGSIVAIQGGASVKSPKTRASIRQIALDTNSLKALDELHDIQEELADAAGVALPDTGFAFSFEPGGLLPPHPDVRSHAFTHIRIRAQVPADVHLHSLRHFHATALDPVISEAQKQTRLGRPTVQMARHYTDGVDEEDRRAAKHIGPRSPDSTTQPLARESLLDKAFVRNCRQFVGDKPLDRSPGCTRRRPLILK